MTDFHITDEDKRIDHKVWMNLKEYICTKAGDNIIVTVSSFKTKRSSSQLRAYWVLMEQIKEEVNEPQGNDYSAKDLSDMLKLRYFYKDVMGDKIPRSIAAKSDCSKEEMREYMKKVTDWCGAMGFKARITSAELLSLINQYEE